MRLPRPRFTVRRLMLLVVMAAALSAGWIEGERRRPRFRRIADKHLSASMLCRFTSFGQGAEAMDRNIDWHVAMAEKYAFAARYPWFPVWPDSPEPPDATESE